MDKLIVVKIGGNVIDDDETCAAFLKSFAAQKEKKILVHGGGKLATKLAGQFGIQQQLVEGRRITDNETLKVVTMVYAGLINKTIVAQLQASGCDAVGLSGADGNVIRAHKRSNAKLDYGFVGDVDAVNSTFLNTLLQQNMTPVLCAVSHDGAGQLLNTNADTIAQETAKALIPFYRVELLYTFEKAGVLENVDNENSVIPKVTSKNYAALKKSGAIFAGMVPKLDNAFAALHTGVARVCIGKAEHLDALVAGTSGTSIVHE
jgi:acetylglutamate kinase